MFNNEKIESKKEILKQKQEELKQLKNEIRNDIAKTRAKKANKLLDKYRDKLIEIASYRKKQEDLISKICYENYMKNGDICEICNDDVFNNY